MSPTRPQCSLRRPRNDLLSVSVGRVLPTPHRQPRPQTPKWPPKPRSAHPHRPQTPKWPLVSDALHVSAARLNSLRRRPYPNGTPQSLVGRSEGLAASRSLPPVKLSVCHRTASHQRNRSQKRSPTPMFLSQKCSPMPMFLRHPLPASRSHAAHDVLDSRQSRRLRRLCWPHPSSSPPRRTPQRSAWCVSGSHLPRRVRHANTPCRSRTPPLRRRSQPRSPRPSLSKRNLR
mmetsp:Transcript_14967/g.44845  ORF Transcript_14967/g.44845 Transcript_14967/m.44845 type:complete len:231 (-) Transcript_14967:621-1313(-)